MTSSRPLPEQGELWGLAGKSRENFDPLQGAEKKAELVEFAAYPIPFALRR
jgi:hypothetical protein